MENISDKLRNIVVTDIDNMITVASPKGRQEYIHNRKSYGLSFCTEGSLTYIHNGKEYVSDPEHAIILPQGQSYMLMGEKKGVFPVINFRCIGTLCDTHTVIPIENTDAYIKDYEQMRQLKFFDGNRAKLLSIFYNIVHRLASQPTSATLTPALKYIEQNIGNASLNNETLAELCHISEVYFRKLFASHYQTTPKQFIIDLRLNKAKQLLSDGTMKVSAISEQCGFASPYHFCRTFKKHVGVTPTEYMMSNRTFKI